MSIDKLNIKLDQHIVNFEEYKLQEADKFNRLLTTQQENTDAITKLTMSLKTLVDDTSSIVQLQKDFTGAARVGQGVQNFMVWCLKWGAIGAGVVSITHYVVNHFNH